MLFLVLFISIKSYIPLEYRQLVTEALKSAEIKTPKELREDTKYPGVYEGERHHFRLTKILTSAKTKDIKGFAFNEHHCAIVKRKQFKLQDGFTIADPKTQSIYLLHRTVASEDNVIVYESQKINIFHIMTDFKLESSTDKYINSLPLSSKERATLRPKAELSYPYHWDEERDRPELEELDHTNIQAGVGYILKLGFSTSISFNSIWDISISARITLEGKWGVEVLIPDDCEFQIPDYEFRNKQFEIPELGYSFKFLGIDISLGLFINFAIELIDMKVVIPLSFDYLKGHYFIATKYYEITPNSIVDSKWELTFNELPAADNIKEVIKNFKIDDIKFLATFQFRPFFSLEFKIGEIGTVLELGIKLPFVFTFSFDKMFCNFPFLKADVTFPVAMYYNFEGIKINDYELISEKSDEFVFYEHTFPTFCVGKRRITSGSNDEEEDDSMYTVGYYITHSDIYEQRNENTAQVRKQISVDAINKELYVLDKHTYPLALYQDVNHKSQSDIFTYIIGHVGRDKLRWAINYVDDNKMVTSDYFELKVSEMKFNEKNEMTIPIQINKNNNDNSDVTYFNANIEKTPFTLINGVFRRKSKHVTYYCTENNKYSYTLLIIDDNGERKFDDKCTFLPQYANTEDFA